MQKTKKGLNVISLFDGYSGAQLALKRAGIKVNNYYSVEIDKHCIKVTKNNFPNTIFLGCVKDFLRWKIKERIDLIIGGSPCFVKGTKILTSVGIKNIEEVKVGDYVLTHKNRWKKVLKVGSSYKETMKLKYQGGATTEVTKNHPYYISQMKRKRNNKTRKYHRTFSKFKWIDACKIKKDDFLAIPIIKNSKNIYKLSKDECFVLGRYIADGHTRKDYRKEPGREHSRHWSLILSIGMNKFFKTKLKNSVHKHTKNVHRMCFYNKRLVEIAEKECGIGSINKKISTNLLKLPKPLLKELIEGIISGDGSCKNGRFRISTISRELADSLVLAIAKVYNVACGFEFCKKPPTCVIEGRTVNQNHVYTVSFTKEVKKQSNFHVTNNHILVRAKDSFKTNLKKRVYNLEVEGDNSYIANNVVVHNCQGFSSAGKGENFNDERSALFFIFIDCLWFYNPSYFLLENVYMKKEWQETINSFLSAAGYPAKPIDINSELVSAQKRRRLYWTNIPFKKLPKDKGILLKDIIENGKVDRQKPFCLDANYFKGGNPKQYFLKNRRQLVFNYSSSGRGNGKVEGRFTKAIKALTLTATGYNNRAISGVRLGKLSWRKLTPIECERLQTLPDNYTEGVSNTQRYKMLGNGFTIDVIAYLLKPLKREFLND